MSHPENFVWTFFLVSCILLVAPSFAFNTCAEIRRCSECVFDPTSGVMPLEELHCGWCEATRRCLMVNETIMDRYTKAKLNPDEEAEREAFIKEFCPDLRERQYKPVCSDMSCSAARTTNNIYICRTPTIVALVFAFLLLALDVVVWLWLWAVRQLPWRLEPRISRLVAGARDDESVVVAGLITSSPSPPLPLAAAISTAASADQHASSASPLPAAPAAADGDPPTLFSRRVGKCPLCKLEQPVPLGPGEVCHWCEIARFGFVPLYLGACCAVTTIALIFGVSLKPWFSNWYYAYTILSAFVVYALGLAYIVRWRSTNIHLFALPDAAEDEEAGDAGPRAAHRARLCAPQDVARAEQLNAGFRCTRSTLYIQLALKLRGRTISAVYPQLTPVLHQLQQAGRGGPSAPDAASSSAAAAAAVETPSSSQPVPISPNSSGATTRASSAATSPLYVNTTEGRAAAPPGEPAATSAPAPALHPREAGSPSSPDMPDHNLSFGCKYLHKAVSRARDAGTAAVQMPESPRAQDDALGVTSPAAPQLFSEAFVQRQKAETSRLLGMDVLEPQWGKTLKENLSREEFILWHEQPPARRVMMEYEWLVVDLSIGVLFGVWLVALSTVEDDSYMIPRLTSTGPLIVTGLICIVCFAALLMVTVRGCTRLYVLTNERLLTVFDGVIRPVITTTEVTAVRFAAVCGYTSILTRQPSLIFSWEVPATERKMPSIKSHSFSGIRDLQTFLYYFRAVVPKLPARLDQSAASMKHERQVWRLHLFICAMLLVTLPVLTVYPHALPDFLSCTLFLFVFVLILTTVHRGLRVEQTTYAPLSLAEEWIATRPSAARERRLLRPLEESAPTAARSPTSVVITPRGYRGRSSASSVTTVATASPSEAHGNPHRRSPAAESPKQTPSSPRLALTTGTSSNSADSRKSLNSTARSGLSDKQTNKDES